MIDGVVKMDYTEYVAALLLKKGNIQSPVEVKCKQSVLRMPLLLYLVKAGETELLRLCFESKSSIDFTVADEREGKNILHWMIHRERTESDLIQLLKLFVQRLAHNAPLGVDDVVASSSDGGGPCVYIWERCDCKGENVFHRADRFRVLHVLFPILAQIPTLDDMIPSEPLAMISRESFNKLDENDRRYFGIGFDN